MQIYCSCTHDRATLLSIVIGQPSLFSTDKGLVHQADILLEFWLILSMAVIAPNLIEIAVIIWLY